MERSDLVAGALKNYGILDFKATALKSNESLATKITDKRDGGVYLLRIHEPNVGGMLGVQRTFEGLSAEMVFRSALATGTGLTLQMPVVNREGNYISSVVDAAGKRSLFCTLLTIPVPFHPGSSMGWRSAFSARRPMRRCSKPGRRPRGCSGWRGCRGTGGASYTRTSTPET